MNIAAIETMYNGILFRSRLEATWAAFFDLCGWKWIYEPMDLKGWVPDFEIITKGNRRLLCEVKPENLQSLKIPKLDQSSYAKVKPHINDYTILLLGIEPFLGETDTAIGYLLYGWERKDTDDLHPYEFLNGNFNYEPFSHDRDFLYWDEAAFKVEGNKYGLSQSIGEWNDFVGEVFRKRFDYAHVGFQLFKQAKNMTRTNYRALLS